MTVIALDDEPIALAIIEKYAAEIPDVQLIGKFTDTATAAEFLKNNHVDLLISDVNMPDESGLTFVRDLPDERPMVIFLTAYKEYAHQGFDLNVVDYLVKPVAPERFKKALQKAQEWLQLYKRAESSGNATVPNDEHFFVFSDYIQVKITIADILFIESMGDYAKIHLASQDKPVVTLERLKNLAAQLEPHGFRRIHRSFLVNFAKIEAKQRTQIQVGGTWLPVGETYLK